MDAHSIWRDLENIKKEKGFLVTDVEFSPGFVTEYLRPPIDHVNCRCNIGTKAYNPIARVIFNDPATIIFWRDGTKTVVKCGDNDIYDREKGLAMAIAKKYLGNKGNYNNILKKYLKEEEK